MNRTAEHDPPLTVSAERQTAPSPAKAVYDPATQLGDVFAITDPLLSFNQVGERKLELPDQAPSMSILDQIIERCDKCGAVIKPERLDDITGFRARLR